VSEIDVSLRLIDPVVLKWMMYERWKVSKETGEIENV